MSEGLYTIFCVTEGVNVQSLLPGDRAACPNDSSHVVSGESLDTTVANNSEYFESLPVTSFSGTIPSSLTDPAATGYQDKLNVTTSDLPAGTYMIFWSYGWRHEARGNDFIGRIVLDTTTVDLLHLEEPREFINQRHNASGQIQVIFASSGTHNIVLQFGTSVATIASEMFDARIEIVRIV